MEPLLIFYRDEFDNLIQNYVGVTIYNATPSMTSSSTQDNDIFGTLRTFYSIAHSSKRISTTTNSLFSRRLAEWLAIINSRRRTRHLRECVAMPRFGCGRALLLQQGGGSQDSSADPIDVFCGQGFRQDGRVSCFRGDRPMRGWAIRWLRFDQKIGGAKLMLAPSNRALARLLNVLDQESSHPQKENLFLLTTG